MGNQAGLFQQKDFMLLWIGHSLSVLGNRFCSIAFLWYVMVTTGSALALGISVICFSLPALLCMPFAGVVADKNRKKQVLILTDLVNGVIMFLLAFVVSGSYPLSLVYVCIIVSSMMTAFFNPALSASIPLLVGKEMLPKANSLTQITTQLANILGPAIAGMLIAMTDMWLLFVINGISFLVSAFFESFITIPAVGNRGQGGSFLTQFREGTAFVVSTRKLLFLVVAGGVIINFFLAPINIFLTVICNQILQIGAEGLGVIEAAISLGTLLGGLLILASLIKDKLKMAIFGLSLEGVALLIAGLLPGYFSLILFALLLGLGISFASVGIGTFFQTLIPESKMGRVTSLLSAMSACTVPLGTLFGSIVVGHYSVFAVLTVFGVCVTVTGLALCYPFADMLRKGRGSDVLADK